MPTKTYCDHCNKDITYAPDGKEAAYILFLKDILKREKVRRFFALQEDFPSSPVGDDCYFCGIDCLQKWLKMRKEELAKKPKKQR